LGRLVDRRYPDYIYAKIFEVVELLGDAGDVAPSIAVGVQEGSWVYLEMSDGLCSDRGGKAHLIYNRLLPPSMFVSSDIEVFS
jgi:hypothetical protein